VLDPFVGSGTTLVQANELGVNAIGYDISAFNVLLAQAKTKHYDLKNVKREILDILEFDGLGVMIPGIVQNQIKLTPTLLFDFSPTPMHLFHFRPVYFRGSATSELLGCCGSPVTFGISRHFAGL
jgi:hypothetical protein